MDHLSASEWCYVGKLRACYQGDDMAATSGGRGRHMMAGFEVLMSISINKHAHGWWIRIDMGTFGCMGVWDWVEGILLHAHRCKLTRWTKCYWDIGSYAHCDTESRWHGPSKFLLQRTPLGLQPNCYQNGQGYHTLKFHGCVGAFAQIGLGVIRRRRRNFDFR